MSQQFSRLPALRFLALVLVPVLASPARGQLFESLQAFGSRLDVGDPEVASTWESGMEGPKGIAAGDFDGDGRPDLAASNLDGTVTVLFNQGRGDFSDPLHLRTGTATLREVIVADLTRDGALDIAAAALVEGTVVIFPSLGGRRFGEPIQVPTWPYARNLAAGDFDGDGTTDLAVAGSTVGLRQLRGLPEGGFAAVADFELFRAGDHSKPPFSLEAVRPLGSSRDELLATHAWSGEICLLASGAAGVLEVKACLAAVSGTYDIDVAPIVSPAGGRPDLVTVHRDLGVIQVRRGRDGAQRFEEAVHAEIQIPGGPRSAEVVDIDGDGWLDIAVVLRNLDRVVTIANEAGVLKLASEMPVGRSPREVAAADFDGDRQLDLAVINRLSADVSVLIGSPGRVGFSALDQVYLVDGEVRGLRVHDFDGDGRDDVIQLHGASGDVSVRLSRPDGSLAPPKSMTVGLVPADLAVEDVNNDGWPDAVAVSLGHPGIEEGSVAVRLGQGGGTLGPEQRFPLPADVNGSLFAVEVADFNGDGHVDVAAGYMDCRISFFAGRGDGTFRLAADFDHAPYFLFGYEVRSMAAGDFDQDGDIDLAGASVDGHLVVAESHGDLLRGTQLDLAEYRPSATLEGGYPTTALVSAELNGDGDLDLVVGSAVGAIVYHGAEGTRFVASREALPGTGGLPASSVAEGDFDGDGDGDMAVACEVLACAFILTRDERGDFLPALTVDIPAGDFIGTGDLDGDGFADLVGSGEVLWTALSSRKAKPGEPPRLEDDRERIRGVVLNEILAINNLLPLKENGGRKSDWIELYNGSGAPFSLAGARVRLEAPDANPAEYTFLEGTVLEDGGHLVLVASKTPGALHLGFKVPGGGGTIVLLGRSGEELDRVRYPGQFENVSFGRFRDGLASFSFNPYPSPGAENADNGPVPPQASLLAVAPARSAPGDPLRPLRPGEPIRFFARARDDVGVMSMSVLFRRLGSGDAPRRVFLFDDGMHGDGGMQDGLFSGTYEAGLWPGGSIEFHLEVLDLSGETVQVPEEAFFGSDPSLEVNYRLGVESAPAGLEISELVALNASGLLDEAGGTADWVEVRNCSAAPMSLGGVYLGDRFPENEGWFAFPADATLAPGQQVVVFCDGDLEQGPLHAPFRLDGDGGRLVLMRRTPEGGHALLDAVDYGAQADDVAWGRTGCGGGWERMAPSPRSPNPGLSAAWGDVDLSRALDLTDPIAVLNYLFRDGKLPCPGAADVTRDSKVDISDPISLLQYLFLGGGAPPGGWTSCG